jgi:glycosyltransferase involved in cell wall biosynthesis/peptidase E
MKIAQIVCTFPPYKGGMGNVAFEFSKGLINLGHQVTVFTPLYSLSDKKEIEESEIQVIRLKPLFAFGNSAILNNLSEQLKNFDIIHLHYPFFGTAGFVSKFKKQYPEKKLIITYHMDAVGGGVKGVIFWLYAKIFMPKILTSADKITVSSIDYLKHSQAKNIYKKYPDKFIELPFGVDLELYKPAEKDKELMNKFGIQPKTKTILFVGGLDKAHYFKGLNILIQAVNILRGSTPLKGSNPFPLIKVIIVGQGDLKQYYQSMVEKLGLSDIIFFVDNVSRKDLPKYYNLCDLFVLPSINKAEAFGLVLLEAMACGKAVLVSDLPGVRTVPTNESIFKTGSTDDFVDKISSLLSDSERLKLIGNQNLKKIIANNNWTKIVKELEIIYFKHTKVILHGGNSGKQNDNNDLFFKEILKNSSKQARILLVFFAREESEYKRLFNEISEQFNKNRGFIKIKLQIAYEKDFITQVQQSDIVYIHGGKTLKLLNVLKKYSTLTDILKGKIVSGESAGAYVLSTCFYSKSEGGVFSGLGLVPAKIICHYTGINEDKLDQYDKNLKKLLLKDYQFNVFNL